MDDIKKVAVIGCGLLGGSIIRALRNQGIQVFSRDLREETNIYCRDKLGCILLSKGLSELKGMDVIVVCVPVNHMENVFKHIQPHVTPDCLVTDVGSTKERICKKAAEIFVAGNFVGAHPMAGSEKSGVEASSEEIFKAKTCFICPAPNAGEAVLAKARTFWGLMGFKQVEQVEASEHDRIVAAISHLPQCLATLLSDFLEGEIPAEWAKYAGNGLKDTTRIAASDPEVWIPIIQENRENIQRLVSGFQEKLAQVDIFLQNDDVEAFRNLFEKGKRFRKRLDC